MKHILLALLWIGFSVGGGHQAYAQPAKPEVELEVAPCIPEVNFIKNQDGNFKFQLGPTVDGSYNTVWVGEAPIDAMEMFEVAQHAVLDTYEFICIIGQRVGTTTGGEAILKIEEAYYMQ